MTGRAQKAFHCLPAATTATSEAMNDALKARFDPESHYMRFQAEFQARRKKAAKRMGRLRRRPKEPHRQGLCCALPVVGTLAVF